MGILFADAKGALQRMTTLQWVWVLSSAVNIVLIAWLFTKLYSEQPNGFPEQIVAALIVALGPIGTYLLFVTCSLGYGLVIFCGAMQGLGYMDEKETPPKK